MGRLPETCVNEAAATSQGNALCGVAIYHVVAWHNQSTRTRHGRRTCVAIFMIFQSDFQLLVVGLSSLAAAERVVCLQACMNVLLVKNGTSSLNPIIVS